VPTRCADSLCRLSPPIVRHHETSEEVDAGRSKWSHRVCILMDSGRAAMRGDEAGGYKVTTMLRGLFSFSRRILLALVGGSLSLSSAMRGRVARIDTVCVQTANHTYEVGSSHPHRRRECTKCQHPCEVQWTYLHLFSYAPKLCRVHTRISYGGKR
jgi:hypothetical protein